MVPPMEGIRDESRIGRGKRIPPPSRKPRAIHESEDGTPSLQSEMGLLDDPDRFCHILETIRSVWKKHGVKYNVPYRWQDLEVMRNVVTEVVRKLPFLGADYEDAWPVTVYLQRSLRVRGQRERQSERSLSDEADYEYEGPRLHNIGRRQVPGRACSKKRPYYGAAVRVSAQRFELPKVSGRKGPGTVPRRIHQIERTTSSLSSSSPYSSGSQSTAVPSSTTSSSSGRPASSTPSSSSNRSQPAGTPEGPREPQKTRTRITHSSPVTPAQAQDATPRVNAEATANTVLYALLSYRLPQADAERLAKLLASVGVAEASYLRVLAHMRGRDDWLREMRDNDQMTEIQMRVLREILVRMERA
ncbi:hypothetical protein L226DRAFT_371242 [Lentinus tigrinus ALCF2SS1-7]|uniref:Uncharacterized protein n=1 Tax=Lentinus tigrinus ALCF2SS1-6 TaxID=1328759 RepID=A0A5C2SK93_9APHY|nr:hypothetical protein L227DRAFT_316473 [Lentinus tigrinus ALCF2SS1-6]RPD76252.1 hypothetical protein L226DRAFT_371242 [Lentinus tigrinus ALCF2SS1-7]